jgi:hypothetical protein
VEAERARGNARFDPQEELACSTEIAFVWDPRQRWTNADAIDSEAVRVNVVAA